MNFIKRHIHWLALIIAIAAAAYTFVTASLLAFYAGVPVSFDWSLALLIFGSAYLIGAVPFGIIFASVFGLGNLREIGSGNIGTTNVLRTGNKTAAALTLILDMGKGLIAVLIGKLLSPEFAAIAMLGAIIGHCYPIWLKFRGGKGVATYLGGLLGIAWPLGIAALAIWLVVALISRISSLSALATIAIMPIFVFFAMGSTVTLFVAFSGAVIIWKHQENIGRLMRREESKISFGKKT